MGYWVWAIVPAVCAVTLVLVIVQEIREAIRNARARRRLHAVLRQGGER